MRLLYLIIFILITGISSAQILDTIYANDKKAVALFFPKPIRQAIVGKQHFAFNYNREDAQHFGLLQATPGVESNLLAITSDGQVYSYILKYRNELLALNYFIQTSESIGYEKPQEIIVPRKMIEKVNDIKGLDYYKKFSAYLLKRPSFKLTTSRKKGMKLIMEQIVYQDADVYLVIKLKNTSEIDFEIDYLNLFTISGIKKRKASYQKIQHEAIYKYKMPSVIKQKETISFVLVLPKFVLRNSEKLYFELKENKGSRNLWLKSNL